MSYGNFISVCGQSSFQLSFVKVRSHRCEKKILKYYEVSKIVAVCSVDGRKEYRVRWKGDTWVPEQDCNSAMKNYAQSSLKGE